jgi:hypothetical protein
MEEKKLQNNWHYILTILSVDKLFATCFHAGILLDLFDPDEVGGDMFHQNIGWLSVD